MIETIVAFVNIPTIPSALAADRPEVDDAARMRTALSAAGVRAVVTAGGGYCTGPGSVEVRALCDEWAGVKVALEAAGASVVHLDGGGQAVGWYAAEVVLLHRPVCVAPEAWQRELLNEVGVVPADARWLGRASAGTIAGCDVYVAGSLPPHLAAAAKSVTEVPLALSLEQRTRAQRGELSIDERRQAVGDPATYRVESLYPIPIQDFETRPALCVTRHEGLACLLRERNQLACDARVLAHAASTDVRGQIVAGVLPFALAAEAAEVWAVEVRSDGPVRVELSADELRRVAGETRRYRVTRTARP